MAMAVVLGLASALVYGTADFLGGLASKRSAALAVVVWSQLAGLVILVTALAVMRTPLPASADLAWGALAGVGGGGGVALLYRGLAIGRVGVVAPTTAALAASLPVVVGITLGERPGGVALGGVAVALVAIVLVSASPEGGDAPSRLPVWRRPGVREAIGAGLGFALFFVALARAGDASGLWPLLAARSSILVALAAAVITRTSLRPASGAFGQIALVGVIDMLANLLYLLAARRGLLSLVAVLVSLYPATTVLLAHFVLRERFVRLQILGLVAAAAGVVLIGVG